MPSKHNFHADTAKKFAIILGIIYASIGFLVRIFSENPFEMIHILGADEFLPPLWIFNVLCIFWYFVSGAALGIIVSNIICKRSANTRIISVYQGALFFISLFFLSLIWYPLFFSDGKIYISCLIAILTVVSSAVCALKWRSEGILPFIFMGCNSIWLFYIFTVNVLVILQI